MSPLFAASLNLLVNAAVVFPLSLLVVLGVLRLLRVPPGRLRLAFLLLPVAKLSWDLGRGIPAGSFLWAHLGGITRESGSLMVGARATSTLAVKLRTVMTANAAGEQYGLSLGDLAVVGCDRLWAGLAGAVVIAVGLVSMALLLGRTVAAWRFAADRRRARLEGVLWTSRRG